MKTFKEFLEAKQMMLFSTGPKEVYHGTVTGKNNKNIESFRSMGATSSSAGYGQGKGFFVFSDRNTARKHAVGIFNGSATYRLHLDNSGKPMVVTIESVLDPENWDIDYEANYKSIMEYLIKNFEAVKGKLQSDDISVEKTVMGLRPWEKPEYYTQKKEDPHPLSFGLSKDDELELEPMESWLPKDVQAGLADRPIGFTIKAKGISPLPGTNSRTRQVFHHGKKQDKWGFIDDGLSVRIIMDMLQKNEPKIVRSFEELFFANMGPGIAIKYVGKTPLPVKNIEVTVTDGRMMTNQAVDDHYWEKLG